MKKTITIIIIALISNLGFSQAWQNLNCPTPGGQLGDIDRTNNTIYATRLTGGFFKSTDAGATWNDVTTNYPAGQTQNFVCLNSGNILLYMFTGSAFPWYKSTDQGVTWTLISGSTPIGACSVFESSNGTLYWVPGYNGFSTIKTSTDEGATWTSQSAVLKHMAFTSNGDAYGLRYDSGSGSVVLSKSTDNGVTWTDLPAAGLPATCEQIAISPNGNIYVQNGSPVHKSTDNGNTFTSIDSVATAIYTDYNNNLFAGKTSKFRVTSDGGATWLNATGGLIYPSGTVGRIWAHPNGNTYASNYNPATASWGIYNWGSGGASVNETMVTSEMEVSPNPFSSEAILRISNLNGVKLADTELKFYNILGGEISVSTLRGHDEFVIHRENLQAGLYLCQLKSGNIVLASTKIIIQ